MLKHVVFMIRIEKINRDVNIFKLLLLHRVVNRQGKYCFEKQVFNSISALSMFEVIQVSNTYL